MPIITLTFNHVINVSVQVGDVGYYVPTVPIGAPTTSTLNPSWTYGPNHEASTTPHYTNTRENVVSMGTVISVTSNVIECDMPFWILLEYERPQDGDFIMFSKDNKANLSSLLGYYSLLKLRNNSTSKAEMFSVGADFVESSK